MYALLPQLDSLEKFYYRLIGNEPVKQCPEEMLLLQQTFPLLFDIVSIVEGDQLPEALTAFITDLLEKAKSPFSRNGSIPDAVQLDVHRTNDVEYYPCLPVVRSRGDYCLHKEEYSTPILTSWSFLSALCNESPNIPFTVFRMRFSRGKLVLMCMCMLWPLIG